MKRILTYFFTSLLIVSVLFSGTLLPAQAVSASTIYITHDTSLRAHASVYSTSSGGFYKAKVSGKTGLILKSKVTNTKKVKSTKKEIIKYKTVTQNDRSLAKGKTKVYRRGINGTKTVTYEEIYTNGKLKSIKVVSSKVTKKPVDQIIKVGTKTSGKAFLTANQVRSILNKTKLFDHDSTGEVYSYQNFGNISGIVNTVAVFIENGHVSRIDFDGDGYWPYVYADPKKIDHNLGDCEPGTKIIKDSQSALEAATDAVFEKGTSEATEMYNKIIEGANPNSELGIHHIDKIITIGGHKVEYYSDNTSIGLKYTEIKFLD